MNHAESTDLAPTTDAPVRLGSGLTAPVVQILTDDECIKRLGAATVARVGYVTPQGLQIVPLNYRSTGTSIMLSTTPNSSLSQLAEMGASVTLEVDEHDSSLDLVWSVMVKGTVENIGGQGSRPVSMSTPVDAWPGKEFAETLRFTPESYSGRVLRHQTQHAN